MLELTDFLSVVVARSDVERGDIEPTLAVLQRVLSSPENIRAFRERVAISFEGYDHDRRELWEIVEVRTFVAALDGKFPFWLYFLTRASGGLGCVSRCFLLPHLTEEGERTHNTPRLVELLERRWLPALNQMARSVGLAEDDVRDLTESAVEYFAHGPTVRVGTADRMDALIEYIQDGGRVCPMPKKWMEMYDLLGARTPTGGLRKPGVPLILAAWWDSSPSEKRQRLIEHLRYAAAAGRLDAVASYLRSLPETDWCHGHDG